MMNLIENKFNKQLVFAGVLILLGVFGLVDTASANYTYQHESRNDHFFDSKRNNSYRHQRYDNRVYPYRYSHRSNRHHSSEYRGNRHGYRGGSRVIDSRNYYGYGGSSDRQGYRGGRSGYRQGGAYSGDRFGVGRVDRSCIPYRVVTTGGVGGFRFNHDVKNFKQIHSSSLVGKVCGRSNLSFELSKLDPAVSVSISIGGRRFKFGANSGYERKVNSWYRKNYSVQVR